MRATTPPGEWAKGDIYGSYIGRWSRLVAIQFLQWLAVPVQAAWLDVGCGTGALTQIILEAADPRIVTGVDQSEAYLEFARSQVADRRVSFDWGDAQSLPSESAGADAVVSALVLNFVSEPARMVSEMKRVVHAGGVVGLYVWDYAGMMQLIRHFWNAAASVDPAARDLDEGRRFPICAPQPLQALFENSGLSNVAVIPIDIETHFKDFDDYWMPFLGGQGPAPGYAMSLTEAARARLRERLRASLPFAIDGSIPLVARAWAVKGIK